MRRLLGISLRLAVLWCAWWVLAALGVHLALPRLVASQSGTEATLSGIGGFPGMFAIDLSEVRLSDGPTDWQAGDITISARAWNPAHFDLVLAPEHDLRLGSETITFTTGKNRGELALLPLPALPFKGFALLLENAQARSNRGWTAGAQSVQADIWPGEAENSFDITLDIETVDLPLALKYQIDPAGLQDKVIETFKLDATTGFDRPWNRYTLDDPPHPKPTSFDLRQAELTWGDIHLTATGNLEIDTSGQPKGVINIHTPNWRNVYEFAAQNGILHPDDASVWETALQVLSLGRDELNLPVTFQDGFIAYGPIPGGPAPTF